MSYKTSLSGKSIFGFFLCRLLYTNFKRNGQSPFEHFKFPIISKWRVNRLPRPSTPCSLGFSPIKVFYFPNIFLYRIYLKFKIEQQSAAGVCWNSFLKILIIVSAVDYQKAFFGREVVLKPKRFLIFRGFAGRFYAGQWKWLYLKFYERNAARFAVLG